MLENLFASAPLSELIETADLPLDFLSSPDGALGDLLESIYYTDYTSFLTADSELGLGIELLIPDELALNLPPLEDLALVLGAGEEGGTLFRLYALVSTRGVVLELSDVALGLRLPRSVLKPAPSSSGETAPEYAQITTRGSIAVDESFDVSIFGFDALDLVPAMIGDTGIIVSAKDVKLDLSRTGSIPEIETAGFGPEFMGLYIGEATVKLPDCLPQVEVEARDFVIGTGGVSGTIEFAGTEQPDFDRDARKYSGTGAGALFGIPFLLQRVAIEFREGALTRSEITGEIFLPYFDKRLGVEIGIDLDGGLSIEVTGVIDPEDEATDDGLFVLEKENLLRLTVESIVFEMAEGNGIVSLSGQIQPLVGGEDIDWPGFRVDELSIDSEGNVEVEGGWLDLPEQYSVDFHGFNFEITRIGFGRTDAGNNWIGLNGALKFVDELSAGASVEGLKIAWPRDLQSLTPSDINISFEGIGVEFEVPDAIRFKGEVAYREVQTPQGLVRRFDGGITLELPALEMEMQGVLVIGRAPGYTFFAIYLDLSLPAGLPIFNTGLALYGMAGLFALNMEPGKRPDEPWYGLAPGEGWYRRPDVGVTDLKDKWINRRGSLAFGAGVTFGTVSDNGYSFSSKLLLALVLPGPIILLEGKANILKERTKLDEEPTFRAIIVFDGRAGTLTAGLTAEYRYDAESGTLIDISAGVQAFFSFSDPDAWHVYLGERDPKEKRIRAELLSLMEGTAYLMVDPRQLGMGGSIGYDAHYSFGPLSADLEAWIEGHALLNYKPPHFHGELWLHGKVALSVFGFGVGIGADARMSADVFDPFHLIGDFRVYLELPWPLGDVGATVRLEWGPEPGQPPIPLPLEEVAIEHFKSSTSWTLPRQRNGADSPAQQLLKPNYSAGGFYVASSSSSTLVDTFPDEAPVVPLDARPRLTFGRSVHDESGAAINPQRVTPAEERVGDPASGEGPLKVRYTLHAVELQAWKDDDWKTVARSYADARDTDKLSGSWAPVPALPSGTAVAGSEAPTANTKLWLWSRNAFDYDRCSGGAWSERFAEDHPGYPCVFRRKCYDFGEVDEIDIELIGLSAGTRLQRIMHPEGALSFHWQEPQDERWASVGVASFSGGGSALSFVFAEITDARGHRSPDTSVKGTVQVRVQSPARSVSIVLDTKEGRIVGTDDRGRRHDPVEFMSRDTLTMTLDEGEWIRFDIEAQGSLSIAEVCHSDLPLDDITAQDVEIAKGLREQTAQWNQEGFVLTPYTRYRLRVVTAFDAIGEGKLDGVRIRSEGSVTLSGRSLNNVVVEHAYFRTEGPPGLTGLSVPLSAPNVEEVARRDDEGRMIARRPDGQERGIEMQDQLIAGERVLLASELDRLSPYIRQTVPATVPKDDGKPFLARPVYRAYDVGASYNEDYVDLLYRVARRDLALYLYNRNDQPVRDPAGRLLQLPNHWGREAELSLDSWEAHWVSRVNASGCAEIAPADIPRDRTLMARLGHVLDPDTVYEARLTPLLLHSDFRDQTGWRVVDEVEDETAHWTAGKRETLSGDQATITFDTVDLGEDVDLSRVVAGLDALVLFDPQSGLPLRHRISRIQSSRELLLVDVPPQGIFRWEIPGGTWVDQTGMVGSGGARGRAPGTLLIADLPERPERERPESWTDYRFSVLIRPTGMMVQGVMLHYREGRPCLRFSMGRDSFAHTIGFRQLSWIDGDGHDVLAEDRLTLTHDHEYLLTAEAHGEMVRIYLDGELVFEAEDPTPEAERRGAPALYSFRSAGRFRDVRVDDLSGQQPVVYRFSFGTSRFANFFHHLHSFQDEVWPVEITYAEGFAAAAAASRHFSEAAVEPSQDEDRAYTAGLEALGLPPHRRPDKIQVSMVRSTGDTGADALLLRSPEPIDWPRVSLNVALALAADDEPFTQALPGRIKITDTKLGAEQSVTLLARETLDLKGYTIEFRDRSRPALFAEPFDENSLGHYTLRPESTGTDWRREGRVIRYDGDVSAAFAVTGQAVAPLLLRARFDAKKQGTVGVVWGYVSPEEHFRFEWNVAAHQRRVLRVADGQELVLWRESATLDQRRRYLLTLSVEAGEVRGLLDGDPLFDVLVPAAASGRFGFYCAGAPGASFRELSVLERQYRTKLFSADFDRPVEDLHPWTFVDEPPYTTRTSDWRIVGGEMKQLSNIYGFVDAPYQEPGTLAVAGNADWTDYSLHVRLRSDDNDAIGAAFRHQDEDNYYRFSMDRERRYRRLVKRVNGDTMLLWEDREQYRTQRWYDLNIECVGDLLVGRLDGELLFAIHDTALDAGRVALYCRANRAARFAEVRVVSSTSAWTAYHTFDEPLFLAAGTRVRVNATQPVAPDQEPSLLHRTAAGPRAGSPFPQDGVDLRVRGAVGEPDHARRFLPQGRFGDLGSVRMLRRADGTGVLLFRRVNADGNVTPFDAALHRLSLEYRRDNRQRDPGGIVLSQSGSTIPESVVLDLPVDSAL